MNFAEYGTKDNESIVLLHGGGLSWWNYRQVAERLSGNYHVILPILNGHANSDHDFTTIEANAAEIINWIDQHLGGSVLLIGGLSLGGQILLEMLAQRHNVCQYAFIESACVIPSKLQHALIKPAFGSCFSLVQHKWFSKLQFRFLKINQHLFEDYFRDTCAISKNNMISFLQANSLYSIKTSITECTAKAYIFVGEKESSTMHKSAKIIQKTIKNSFLHVLPAMHHGEFSLNHSCDYSNAITNIVNNDSMHA